MTTASASSVPDSEPIPSTGVQPPPSGWRSGPLTGVCTALPAAIVAGLLIHSFYPVFMNEKDADAFGNLPPAIQWQLDRDNSMLVLAVLGGLVAAGLAIGEGLARRSPLTALGAGIACLILGALAGVLAGYVGLIVFNRLEMRHELSDLGKAIRVYLASLTILGAGVGLGVGVLWGRRMGTIAKCVIAGALAGVLAAICYPVLVAAVLPEAITKVFIPIDAQDRLLWCGIFGGLMGIVVPGLAQEPKGTEGTKETKG